MTPPPLSSVHPAPWAWCLLAQLSSLLAAVWFGLVSWPFTFHVFILEIKKCLEEKLPADSILFGSLFSLFLTHQVLSTLNLELHFFFFLNWASYELPCSVWVPHPMTGPESANAPRGQAKL